MIRSKEKWGKSFLAFCRREKPEKKVFWHFTDVKSPKKKFFDVLQT
ncbi:hypothetical protein HMPREF9151_00118 [Hoylesella saccharolytica F0055]|uniref:Uncharacterized protein n=1 Tax=Hoylesella saccharolytica F0055 TaxID=1127699 RepID=L1NKJ7_9BACT|nr:hypothetical protein HMPREF9151_00118 [Hoylesella saccharolytica F0055]